MQSYPAGIEHLQPYSAVREHLQQNRCNARSGILTMNDCWSSNVHVIYNKIRRDKMGFESDGESYPIQKMNRAQQFGSARRNKVVLCPPSIM